MLAFGFVMFAIGALLAGVASATVFVVVSLVLAVLSCALAIHVGWPTSVAVLSAIGCFVSGQVGYVAGIGVRALLVAKFSRASQAPSPALRSEADFEKPRAAPLNGGR
jgi:hypothetical protein